MSSPFVGAWTIRHWGTDESGPVTGGIPTDGAKEEGPLFIAHEPTESSEFLRLLWLDQNGNPCSISGLLPVPGFPEPMLAGENLLASFGSKNVTCRVSVTLDATGLLTCQIAVPSAPGVLGTAFNPDAGAGTFTATANGGPSYY